MLFSFLKRKYKQVVIVVSKFSEMENKMKLQELATIVASTKLSIPYKIINASMNKATRVGIFC